MNNRTKRIVAGIIDFYLICLLSSAVVCVFTLGQLDVTPFSLITYLISYSFFTLGKDFVFVNSSIGKRILKLKVIKLDETKFTIFDALKKNFPIIVLLPIEACLIVVGKKRIGDIWSKTLTICDVSACNNDTHNI